MEEAHEHHYQGIEVYRIVDIQDRPMPYHYKGTPGDKALLRRACTCGKGQAFEYGPYKAMLELHKSLTKGKVD